jgi:hypothetical protein
MKSFCQELETNISFIKLPFSQVLVIAPEVAISLAVAR